MPEPDAQALLKTANRLYREGDHARARVLLDALSDIFPDDPKIWSALATVVSMSPAKPHVVPSSGTSRSTR